MLFFLNFIQSWKTATAWQAKHIQFENISHLFHDRLVCYLCSGAVERYIQAEVIVSMNICLQYCNVHYIYPLAAPLLCQTFHLCAFPIRRKKTFSTKMLSWYFKIETKNMNAIVLRPTNKSRTQSKTCKKLHKKRQRKKPNN